MDSLPKEVIPIAQLDPGKRSAPGTLRGVVTIIWPYSASKQSISLLLAERDFRLRKKKGQVRLTFRGHSAAAVASAKVSSGDEFALSLEGATFQEDGLQEQTPGRGIEWQLVYSRQLHLLIRRADEEATLLRFARATPTPEPESTSLLATPDDSAGPSRLRTPEKDSGDQIWESPAFLTNKGHYDHPFLTHFNVDDDDDELNEGRKRSKRTRFGRESGQWRFAERDQSLTKDAFLSEVTSRDHINDQQLVSHAAAELAAHSPVLESFGEAIPFEQDTHEIQPVHDLLAESAGTFAPVSDLQASVTEPEADTFYETAPSGVNFSDFILPMDLPPVGPEFDVPGVPSLPVPTSQLLASPELHSFPSGVSPILGNVEQATAIAHPTTDEDAGDYDTQKPASPTAPEVPQSLEPLQEAVLTEGATSHSQSDGNQPVKVETNDGTASKPIEIIDLGSDSSSAEESSHLARSVTRQDNDDSESGLANRNDSGEASAHSSPYYSEGNFERQRTATDSEVTDGDQSDEESDVEQLSPPRRQKERLRTSSNSVDHSRSESGDDTDAEGESYEESDEDREAHSRVVSSRTPEPQNNFNEGDAEDGLGSQSEYSSAESRDDSEKGSADYHRDTIEAIQAKATEASPTRSSDRFSGKSSMDEPPEERAAGIDEGNEVVELGSSQEESSAKSEEKYLEDLPSGNYSSSPNGVQPKLVSRQRIEYHEAGLEGQPSLDQSTEPLAQDVKVDQVGSSPPMQDAQERERSTPDWVPPKLTAAAADIAKALKERFLGDEGVFLGGFTTHLAYFATITSFPQNFNDKIDMIAVVTGQTRIKKATRGPRDYFTTVSFADPWTTKDTGSPQYARALILRRTKSALPICNTGDGIVLRQFKVVHREQKLQLISCDSSAWAVFANGGDKFTASGPPIEIGDDEVLLADRLRRWWAALEHENTENEGEASSTMSREEPAMKKGNPGSMRPTSPERHVLRDGVTYSDGPGNAVHKLRDGSTYSD